MAFLESPAAGDSISPALKTFASARFRNWVIDIREQVRWPVTTYHIDDREGGTAVFNMDKYRKKFLINYFLVC